MFLILYHTLYHSTLHSTFYNLTSLLVFCRISGLYPPSAASSCDLSATLAHLGLTSNLPSIHLVPSNPLIPLNYHNNDPNLRGGHRRRREPQAVPMEDGGETMSWLARMGGGSDGGEDEAER